MIFRSSISDLETALWDSLRHFLSVSLLCSIQKINLAHVTSQAHRARFYPHTRLALKQKLDGDWQFVHGHHKKIMVIVR